MSQMYFRFMLETFFLRLIHICVFRLMQIFEVKFHLNVNYIGLNSPSSATKKSVAFNISNEVLNISSQGFPRDLASD